MSCARPESTLLTRDNRRQYRDQSPLNDLGQLVLIRVSAGAVPEPNLETGSALMSANGMVRPCSLPS